ncbi:MAG: hypothetical protein HOW97_07500 [Catenulispora sp.]|nr:hypothetical protein [Catenulispora sp.]
MDAVIARVVAAVTAAGFGDDDAPHAPSSPVQIGTGGVVHHARSEIGSWQTLILMFVGVVVVGAAVLMYVVRQRRKLLERRRLRRMAEVARLVGSDPGPGPGGGVDASPSDGPSEGPLAAHDTSPTTTPTTTPTPTTRHPSAPGRPAPNA